MFCAGRDGQRVALKLLGRAPRSRTLLDRFFRGPGREPRRPPPHRGVLEVGGSGGRVWSLPVMELLEAGPSAPSANSRWAWNGR